MSNRLVSHPHVSFLSSPVTEKFIRSTSLSSRKMNPPRSKSIRIVTQRNSGIPNSVSNTSIPSYHLLSAVVPAQLQFEVSFMRKLSRIRVSFTRDEIENVGSQIHLSRRFERLQKPGNPGGRVTGYNPANLLVPADSGELVPLSKA